MLCPLDMSTDAPVKLTHNEDIKAAIPTLAGTLAATLADHNRNVAAWLARDKEKAGGQ